jgi:hypothetical protein
MADTVPVLDRVARHRRGDPAYRRGITGVQADAQRRKEPSAPLRELFRERGFNIVRVALTFMANNAAGYILIAFMISKTWGR